MHWIDRITSEQSGYERDVVDRFSARLIAFARKQLPPRLSSRVDPEDVVQSVYRSFFRRINEGEFSFEESHDVWRLLAAMTYHKALRAIRFHQQQRRDVRVEIAGAEEPDLRPGLDDQVGPEHVVILYDTLEHLFERIPVSYREIVILRLEGNSIAEIAVRVERSHRTVLRALARLSEVACDVLESNS